jgi:pimeloyl-[acyl-carrier protein] synthase
MSLLDEVDDPYARLSTLRELEPVYWSDEVRAWVFTRYDDIAKALRDPRWRRTTPDGIDIPTWPAETPAIASVMGNQFLMMDPPDHTRLRGLVNRAFTPSSIAAMEARIVDVVDELLRAVGRRRTFDLIADFAIPLPATVIAELLGVPVSDLARFKRWSDDFVAVLDLGPGDNWPQLEASVREFATYVRKLAIDRRQSPRDDLLSALVARHEGDALTEAELVSTVILLIAAGHETTTNLIGNGVLTLIRHPDQLGRLRADPSFAPTAVEEILRFEPPVQATFRLAGEEIVAGGKRIEPGQDAMFSLAAGNRDPSVFEAPDDFDIGRSPNRHLAFGMGAHFCIGSPLARLEGRIALAALVARFPVLRLARDAPAPSWRSSLAFRGLDRLIVEVR